MPTKTSRDRTRERLGIDQGAPIEFDLDAIRPRTRGECRDGIRPCPWVACRHHLYLEVNAETGSIKMNFPHHEPDELRETCSVDVGERGGITLEEVGELTNLTRERVRQIEMKAAHAMKSAITDAENEVAA